MTQHAIGRGTIGRPSTPKAPLRVVASPASPKAIMALFEDQLPRLIAQRSDLFDAVRGAIVVMVHGVGGWRISFGDHRSPVAVTRAVDLEGDCVAVFSIGGFSALLDGQSGAQAPVVLGDARLLSRLGQVMVEPARGPLGAREEARVAENDGRLLSRLGQVMVEPARGPLGARLSSTASVRR